MGALFLSALPATAQPANFKSLTLDGKTTVGMMMGSTGGSTSLPAIVGTSDRHNQKCLGFGDPTPDHTLVLQQPFSKLKLQVDSGGADTTILVASADGVIRCGDDSGSSKDASLEDTDWRAGTYRIWIGTVAPNTSRDYRLVVKAN